MRALGVELAEEGIEAFLLLQAVEAGRACGFFFKGQMHALMPAILLRMAWLDAFDRDAKAKPPDREL